MKYVIQNLCVIVVMLLAHMNASAYSFEVSGIQYDVESVSEFTVTASAIKNISDSIITIPSSVEYNGKTLTVVSVGDRFASDNDEIVKLKVDDGVVRIGKEAFKSCGKLRTVELKGVQRIDDSAFEECANLIEIKLGSKLQYIGIASFRNCSRLSSISFPETLINIASAAFSECNSINFIKFPKLLTIIGSGAFKGCEDLESVEFSNVNQIGESCFQGCQKLKHVELSGSNTTIDDAAFENCVNLDEISGTRGIISIGDRAFCNNEKLEAFEMPDNIKSIGEMAFQNCKLAFSSLCIPATTESIGAKAFSNCISISDFKLDDSDKCISISDSILDGCRIKTLYLGRDVSLSNPVFNGVEDIVIGPKVTYLNNRLFSNLDINAIEIPSNVTQIGRDVFENCNINYLRIDDSPVPLKIGYSSSETSKDNYVCYSPFYQLPIKTLYLGRNLTYAGNLGKRTTNTVSVKRTVTYTTSKYYSFKPIFNDSIRTLFLGNNLFYLEGSYTSKDQTSSTTTRIDNTKVPNETITTIHYTDYIYYIKPMWGSDPKFQSIFVSRLDPPTFDFNAFTDDNYINTKLYVPDDGLDNYKSSSPWNKFWSIESIDNLSNGIEHIQLSTYDLELEINAKYKISAKLYPIDIEAENVEWTVSDPEIISITQDGTIIGLKSGKSSIIAKCGIAKAICEVTVNPILVHSITLDSKELYLKRDDYVQLNAIILPENATDKSLKWTSDDESIAKVSDSGLVTACGYGETLIKTEAIDGSGVNDICKIIVDPSAELVELNRLYKGISISVNNGMVVTQGKSTGEIIYVFDANGSLIAETTDNTITLTQRGVFIVKIGGEVMKIII